MSQITTTLNDIRKHNPCEDGWEKLLKHLGKTKADDEPFPMSTILDSNGLKDCLWAMRCRPDLDYLWRLYAVDCARQVQHLLQDQRSVNALDVAERYALGTATGEELDAAREAAWRALAETDAAEWAAREAERTAARTAAGAAARTAARAAARTAAGAAARAAAVASAVARGAVAMEKQSAALREMLDTGQRPDWSEIRKRGEQNDEHTAN